MSNFAVKSGGLILLALVFALAAPMDGAGQFGFSPVHAADDKPEKKQKTRRVPSLSESVYKKLGEGQEAIDAKDYNLAQEIIQGALDRSRRYNENEIANLHNMLGYIYYLKDDYDGAIREYKIVVNQGKKSQKVWRSPRSIPLRSSVMFKRTMTMRCITWKFGSPKRPILRQRHASFWRRFTIK